MKFIERICATDNHPVFLAGSGLSFGLVPMPLALLELVIDNRQAIEEKLGVKTSLDLAGRDPSELYKWAGEVVRCLETRQAPQPTLAVAHALGVTTNAAWLGKVNVPLRGSAPRHRVIARLAREGLWKAIWSLNWDCVLETALECVGLPARPSEHGYPRLPWNEWHVTWTSPEDFPESDSRSIVVCKPHGCVRKLLAGNLSTFRITLDDLSKINLDGVNAYVRVHFTGTQLLACGWSASEPYLRALLNDIAEMGELGTKDPESTVHFIDPKTSEGHKSLIELYKADEAASCIRVAAPGLPSADDLFLWIQSNFGVSQLCAAWPGDRAVFQQVSGALRTAGTNYLVDSYFDDFLPAWSLLCFRLGFVSYFVPGGEVAEEAIPPDRPDEHIPASYHKVPRHDLVAAGRLLLKMWNRSREETDFSSLPGALWIPSTSTAIVPMPNWNASKPERWHAYGEMMKRNRWRAMNQIESIKILPLCGNQEVATNVEAFRACARAIASRAWSVEWAEESKIGLVCLDDM